MTAVNTEGVHTVSGTTFSFRRRWAQIDWRSLSALDVDKIAQTVDVQTLQENILNVTFCNVINEEFRNVDVNFIKLFRLSQLIIEYLLYTQQYLTEQVHNLQVQLQSNKQELENVQKQITTRQEEIKAVKKENRKRRKIIESYQQMLNAGATGLHPCSVCHREFISNEFLMGHLQRRHPDHYALTKPSHPYKSEELETKVLEQVNQRLLQTERQLRQELSAKEAEILEQKVREFEEWKKQEQQQLKVELETYRQSIMSQCLEQQQENTKALRQTLEEAQTELHTLKSKKLSSLEGDGNISGGAKAFKKTQREMVELKDQLLSQLNAVQTSVEQQNKLWKKKLKEMTNNYDHKLKESQGRLEVLEQTVQDNVQQHEDNQTTENVKLLQQQLQQQEQLLTSQQEYLAQLQEKETTVVVSEPPPPSLSPSSSESSDDEVNDYNDGLATFSPFPDKPHIKSQFNHNIETLQNMRLAVEGIFKEGLHKRGINDALLGLTQATLNDKMNSLEQERQSRIQTHVNFMEYRNQIEQEINVSANKVKKPPKHCQNEAKKPPVVPMSKPPSATPTKSVQLAPVRTTPINVISQIPVTTPPISPIHDNQPIKSEEEDDIISDLSDETDDPEVEETPVVPFTLPNKNEDSSWDSNDSIEQLIAPPTKEKVSSTPIKPVINLGLDPTKKPVGGVPVMVVPHPIPELESEDSDTFTLSEASAPPTGPPTQPKLITAQSIPTLGSGETKVDPQLAMMSSRSALTTVTDDFEGSDFSDLEVTHLT